MHKAIITKLVDIEPITGADFIVSAGIHNGTVEIARAVVNKRHAEHELGIYFPPDLQLSEEYAEKNDLIARFENGKKIGGGYFDHRRRVVAQRFKGVRSEGLWMPLSSLSYTNKSDFILGDEYDEVNGHKLCAKYLTPQAIKLMNSGKSLNLEGLASFPRHEDTEQLIHAIDRIPTGATIFILEKLHGTSHGKANIKTKNKLSWWKRAINSVIEFVWQDELFPRESYNIVHRSRNRLLSVGMVGYHGSEDFRYAATAAYDLAQDEAVYGELVGYANGKSIMPPHPTQSVKEIKQKYGEQVIYHYGCSPNECKFFAYNIKHRIAGKWVDLPYDVMIQRANVLGYHFIPALTTFTYDGNAENLMNTVKRYAEAEGSYSQSIYANHPSEGVIIRVEHNDEVVFYKYKSYGFKVMEGIVKADDNYVEIEEIS